MAAATVNFFMSSKQQAIERAWYSSVTQLASATAGNTEIILPAEVKEELGHDGITALAQRCSTFGNSHVEVRDDEITNTVRINVMYAGSLEQYEKGSESPSTTPDAPDTPKKSAKVSRPANAFILYRQHHHAATVAKNPGVHNNQISKIIGQMWREEPDSVRNEWKAKSEEVKRQHSKDHPNYQYQPRKPHEKKRRMTKRKAEAMAALNKANAQSSAANTSITIGTGTTPSLSYHNANTLASYTLDTHAGFPHLNLLDDMMLAHNDSSLFIDTPYADVQQPGATTVLPTAANNMASYATMPAADFTAAQTQLTDFENSIEATLARELAAFDAEPMAQEYNDLESRRFDDFLVQMPEHMWGMEFVE